MKKIFVACLLLAACCGAEAQEKFVINGSFSNIPDNKWVHFSMVDDSSVSVVPMDSVLMRHGKFSFHGTVDGSFRGFLLVRAVKEGNAAEKQREDMLEFYVDKGTTTITGTDKMSTATVKAGPTQRDFLQYKEDTRELTEKMLTIMKKLGKAADAKNDSLRRIYSAEVKVTLPQLEAAKDSFVYHHPDSYISLDLVRQKGMRADLAAFERLYKVLTPHVLQSRMGKVLTTRLEIARNTTPGHPMDFTQNDTTGAPFALASLKGKYVLVDFWASWCVPCRAENPNVVKAYDQLKDKNFEIVSISLDNYKRAWVQAIQKDGMPWIHVSDLKGWKNDLAVRFGINSVPQNFLLDPNGIILARNLRGEDLYEKLKTAMAAVH